MILMWFKRNVFALRSVENNTCGLGAPRSVLPVPGAGDGGIPAGFVRNRQLGFDPQPIAINLEISGLIDEPDVEDFGSRSSQRL
jgi:hypothetical protein